MSNTTGTNTEARDIYPSETPDVTYWVLNVQSVLCRPSCVCSSFYISQGIVCSHMIDFFLLPQALFFIKIAETVLYAEICRHQSHI
jgi:hypothetical protein